MGHSINPTSFRLYFSKYWNSNWYTLGNYSYFLIKNLQLNEYFYSFFHKNKRNRIFFYKKFMYDSLSIHKKINRFFITLNVFDFRIKTYKNISHSTKFYSPVPQNGIRIEYEDLRFKSRKKLTRFLLKKYKIKFNKMPWLYKRYIMKLYFNLNVTNTLLKKKKYLTFFGNKLYSKKFFFAYLIYMKQFNYRLNYSNILNLPLKNFIFDILTNYYKFLNNSKNSNLLASSDMYNKKNFNNKSLLNIEYTNISRIKDKIKLIKQKNNFNVLNKKTKKFKKFFLFNLRNLIFTKNLILKYKNLLFLINKRIDLFKNKYNLIFINKKKLIQNKKIRKFNLLSNLYWRRDRLIALIFFLRKRSKIAKLKFKNEIFLLKNQIIKLKEISNLNNVEESQMNILFNNAKEKVYQLLAQKLIFLNLFNSINVLNKNFLVYNYLNLLDKSKLLRFNLRFALYKQAYLNFISKTNTKNLYKINIDKNITNIRKLRYSIALLKKKKLKNRRISSFSFNREFTTSLFKSIKFNKLILYKIKNFRNVFNLKLAKINVRSVLNKYKLKKKENQFINKLNLNTISTNLTFDRLSDVNKLIDIQIDSVKSYERKKLVLLKKNKTNNYKYFLKFIALKNIYNFNNSNNKSINLNNYSFKFLLKSVIKDLKKKTIIN